VDLVPAGDIAMVLEQQMGDTETLLGGLGDEQGNYRYAPGKWSVKEVIGHLIDSERVFAYRALRIARNDKTPLPGFEQDDYVAAGGFDRRSLADLAREFEHVRNATLDLIRPLSKEAFDRRGVANNAEVSVRALVWIIAGHELHHKEVLRRRYL
jgi:hypothetical protein